jgi:uncharacterized protein YbjT (DUF2867 family)
MANNERTVTVFGGTGFLGRRVARHLRSMGFSIRIASRHPKRGHEFLALDDPQLQSVEVDIHDERSIANAVAGAYAVVNAVSLYVEHGQETFHSVHVEVARNLAGRDETTANSAIANRPFKTMRTETSASSIWTIDTN